jgi:hypothetical protein
MKLYLIFPVVDRLYYVICICSCRKKTPPFKPSNFNMVFLNTVKGSCFHKHSLFPLFKKYNFRNSDFEMISYTSDSKLVCNQVSCSFFTILVFDIEPSVDNEGCEVSDYLNSTNTKFVELWEIQMIFHLSFTCLMEFDFSVIILQFFFMKGLILSNHLGLKYMS